ncbi:MAG: DegT/DnrJ/EryC1/StrS family aminotransferase [Candidatus Korobacteraceae bacterium]
MCSQAVVATKAGIRVPFLDLKKQYAELQAELAPAILRSLDLAAYIDGPSVRQFEAEFAQYCGTTDCVALDSGTAALHLTFLALNIAAGDEVIVPTNTFIASAAAVVMAGAKVVPVDSDSKTWLLDLEQVEAKITRRTKAVLAVHLYGQPVRMDALREICNRKGVLLIEDAAQAHGARFKGQRVGGLGEVGCFSFYPGKNLGAYGDGGAITTNNSELAERVRRLANHGRTNKYEHGEVGWNFRMDEIQGVVLRHKLKKLDGWNQRRRELARLYRSQLSDLPVRMYEVPAECDPTYHLFVIGVKDPRGLAKHLAEQGIETGFHYPIPVHLQPAFQFLGFKSGDFPVAEGLCQHAISLPLFPEMTIEQLSLVCESVKTHFSYGTKELYISAT